jgi:hypothetical protein
VSATLAIDEQERGAPGDRTPRPDTRAAAESARPALDWGFQPWKERPGRSALAAVAAFGMCVLTLRAGLPGFTALLLCIVFVSMLAPSFAPARCRVDDDGVAVRGASGWVRREWASIRRARLTERGLLVSPMRHARWMDPYRAVFLPFPAARAAELAAALKTYLERHDHAA